MSVIGLSVTAIRQQNSGWKCWQVSLVFSGSGRGGGNIHTQQLLAAATASHGLLEVLEIGGKTDAHSLRPCIHHLRHSLACLTGDAL